ncbi:VOC family protein [Amphibacillus sp. MSJ-3]|uniref:lactoylglutathione lyase n=1 Tax=Amphibacillus sp. MSJ-3 TaxID=2841505 RepID=UPI001C0EDB21|nr:VOC family protein [Amphibacillus sp. MSJ-3]MBU5594124.1 VOC family protein [Amphibacillus sp. MSJ-3]
MKSLHTCIRVKNLDKSLEFYKDAFGYKESRRRDFPDAKFTLVYLTLPGEEYELELTYNYDQEKPYDLGNGYGHIALGVDDLEGKHKELSDKGYQVTKLTGLTEGEPTYFFVIDPDGYKIEIIRL